MVKLLVHYKMVLGPSGEINVLGGWFKLHYILNEGMAFGIQFGYEYGKLGLTLFRLVAMVFIAIYLYRMAKKHLHPGLLWCIALILGGAIGNVVDSIFYGVWLNNADPNAVTPWFHGKVVDMFYLDIWEGYVADWVPFWGGEKLALWPIFNVADAAIFIGVVLILVFQKRFFARNSPSEISTDTDEEILLPTESPYQLDSEAELSGFSEKGNSEEQRGEDRS